MLGRGAVNCVIDDADWAGNLTVQAIGPHGDEIEVSGATPEDAWRGDDPRTGGAGGGRLIR